MAALRALIAVSPSAVVGCDFPFGLPAALVDATSWEAFVLGFGERYATPESFRAACRARARGRELKRAADVVASVPFASYNLRIYRQTFYGIRDLLSPLVRARRIAVLPMMRLRQDVALVMEVCPASALKRLGLYEPYKGRGLDRERARSRILATLVARDDVLPPAEHLCRKMLSDTQGDALDSFIAAMIAFWASQREASLVIDDPMTLIEGRVYA